MDNLQFKNWFIFENKEDEKNNFLQNIIKNPFGLAGLADEKAKNTQLGDIQSEKNVGRGVVRNQSWKEIIQGLRQFRMLGEKNPNDPKIQKILGLNTGNTVGELIDAFVD